MVSSGELEEVSECRWGKRWVNADRERGEVTLRSIGRKGMEEIHF